ncbi:hypothetical protein BDW59DRAFT_163548 [Aspergillus cavernicola]|uniref:Amidohydrolase 3 domain-containing protein n=1 Tax=Aspergillus cavernicola TaxID=176166 RepID=A0ABR4I620_9EURO
MCSHTGERHNWILGNFYLPIHFPDNIPDRRYPDELFPDQPVLIRELSAHSMLLNTTALEQLNINDATPDPLGGRYVRGSDGTLSGEIYENAMDKVWGSIPFPPMSHYNRALNHAVSICHSYGITSAQEAASTMELHGFRELETENRPDFDIYTHIVSAPGSARKTASLLVSASRKGFERNAEGNIDLHFLVVPQDTLLQHVKLYDARGFTCKLHAAGEGSVRLALDTIETVRALNPNGPRT